MTRLVWLGAGAAAGVILLVVLVAQQGWRDVAGVIGHAGWPMLLIVPARLATLALDTRAWRVLLERTDPAASADPLFLLWVASVREAINRLLPVAGVGGDVAGVRLVCLRVDDGAGVTASVVVEILLTIGVLALFCAVGVVLMAHLAGGLPQVGVVVACLLLTLPLPVMAWWLLRHGAPFAWLERMALRSLRPDAPGKTRAARRFDGARTDAAIRRLFEQRGRLARAGGWSLLSYLLGTFETWFALRLLGHPVTVEAAVAIEALTQVTRHAGFIVPAGLGVQEAATLLFSHLAGVGGDVALSLALVKRMREIVLGVPALLSWQWVGVAPLQGGWLCGRQVLDQTLDAARGQLTRKLLPVHLDHPRAHHVDVVDLPPAGRLAHAVSDRHVFAAAGDRGPDDRIGHAGAGRWRRRVTEARALALRLRQLQGVRPRQQGLELL